MTRLIAPRRLWRDGALQEGLALEVEGGSIRRVRPLEPGETPDAAPFLLAPGLTDLQVNGGGGVMVNASPTEAGIHAVAKAHWIAGTGAILPTVITDAPEILDRAVEAVIGLKGERGILGLHIEGPHISAARRGTHEARFIRPFDERTMAALKRLALAGIPTLLTLAPEQAAERQIRAILDLGVVLSMGHTAAAAVQAREALEQGFRCVTHLYNAMTPMSSRDPGVVGTAIDSEAYCGLIADGIHVDWAMARIACRARPRKGRTFLVSDAMATVNGPSSFMLYGREIHMKNGALVNAEGALAGAHVALAECFANAHFKLGLPLEEALAMAVDVPLEAMRLPPPTLKPGTALEDLAAFDENLKVSPF